MDSANHRPGLSRRQLLRAAVAAAAGLAATGLLSACATPAAPTAPTQAPSASKPTSAPAATTAPAAPTTAPAAAKPTTAPAATSAPAAAAKPAAGPPDALISAARAEGTLTWYSSVPPPALVPLTKAFADKYGIKVDANRQTSSTLATLFKTEMESGKVVADVLGTSDTGIMKPAADKGWLAKPPADLPSITAWPEKWTYVKDGATYMHGVGVYTLTYNKQLAGANPPNKWESLLEPMWKGKILLNDPRNTAGALGWVMALHKQYGPSFLQSLGKQDLQFTTSTVAGVNSIAAGDMGILAPSSHWNNTDLIAKGAPLEDAYPSPAMGGSEQWIGLVKGGPHPNAAALFLDFALTEAGQTAMCGELCSSPVAAPKTVPFPADYTTNNLDEAQAQRHELLSLLGLE